MKKKIIFKTIPHTIRFRTAEFANKFILVTSSWSCKSVSDELSQLLDLLIKTTTDMIDTDDNIANFDLDEKLL